jgi:hypothetical protein
MGYDLHIVRTEDWSQRAENPIRLEEWQEYLAHDKDLKLAGINGPYFAVFSDASDVYAGPWLDWVDGEIYSKNPSLRMVRKMISIAVKLQAKVQGDEGEVYTETELHGIDEMQR